MSRRTVRRSRTRTLRAVCVALVAPLAVMGLAGCMTGLRPTLDATATDRGATTGDAAIDAVLQRIDAVDDAVFTAHYTATPASAPVTRVDVTQSSPTKRSVTIGNIRFLMLDGTWQTCRVDTHACADGVDTTRVSNTGLTNDLVFGDAAKRLRHDATIKIAASTPSQATIAGQASTCVLVAVTGGEKSYCALADGVLSRMISPDVAVALDSYTARADASLLTAP